MLNFDKPDHLTHEHMKKIKLTLAFFIPAVVMWISLHADSPVAQWPFNRMSYYSLHYPERIFPMLDSLELEPDAMPYAEVEVLRQYARSVPIPEAARHTPLQKMNYGQLYVLSERLDYQMGIDLLNKRYRQAWEKGMFREKILNEMETKAPPGDLAVDFERGKLYGKMACLAYHLGNRKDAANYELMFYHTKMSESVYGEWAINDYLILVEQYDRVMEINRRRRKKFLKADTISIDYLNMLAQNERIYRAQGDTAKAYAEIQNICRILTLLHRQQRSMLVQSSAAWYADSLKTAALKTASDSRTHTRTNKTAPESRPPVLWNLVCAAASGLLAVGVLIWAIRNRRFGKPQDTHMPRNACDSPGDGRLPTDNTDEHPAPPPADEGSALCGGPDAAPALFCSDRNDSPPPAEGVSGYSGMTDRELYERFCEKVEKRKLYLDPSLNRDFYAELMGVGKNRFSQILQNAGQANLKGYLNNLRLEYAVQLLESRPELSIQGIASQCGLENASTFYRLFKEKYGVNPKAFRNGN